MNVLAIDKGNSRTKVGLQQNGGDIEMAVFANNAEDDLLRFIQSSKFDSSVMSSVAADNLKTVSEYLRSKGNFVLVDPQTPVPIKSKYATPDTLGTDRMAGAIGAWILVGQTDVFLLDAGTCINYECVIEGTYLGGAISPGLEMRLKAMHEHTGKLPQLSIPETPVKLTGDSTKDCMLTGAVMGMANEMEGFIHQYQTKYPAISVVLSGGDGPFLGKYLKNSIFAPHKEVVLRGLIEILKYNLNV